MSTSSLASCSGNSDATSNSIANNSNSAKEMVPFDMCPSCRVHYDFLKRVNNSKVPLILNCRHTVCEDCIRRLCLSNTTIYCPVCREKFIVSQPQIENLSNVFQPNFTLIGQLVWTKNSPKKNMGLVSTGFTIGNRQIVHRDIPEFNFDMDTASDDGDGDYEKTALSLTFDYCSDHKDQFANIHCNDCQEIYCCYCFLENHSGHKANYLYKLSEQEMAQLEKLRIEIEYIFAQLIASKNKVKELKTFEPSSVEFEIKNYFADLHAKLHLAERNIKKRLLTMESEEADLDVVNATLKSVTYRVTQVLNHLRLLDTNAKKLNMKALYEAALELREIPCCLVSDKGTLKPVEFKSNVILDNIEDSITLKAVSSLAYTLQPIEDWDEVQERFEIEKMRRLSGSHKSQEEEIVHVRTFTKVTGADTRKPNDSKSGSLPKTRVVLTHINSLNSFYVQKLSSRDTLNEVNASIGKRQRKRNFQEEFKKNGTYGVYYETKNGSYWRRGQIIDIFYRNPNERQYRVFFLDYGNSQCVTKEKLKQIDLLTVRRPPFAFECKLTNPQKTVFAANAHLQLPQLIAEKDLYLCYENYPSDRNEIKEVDLLIPTSNGKFVSVRELLLDIAGTLKNNHRYVDPSLKLFENSKKFSVSDEERVVVTYIRDPTYICVQLVSNLEIIEKMKKDMNEYYKKGHYPISCIPVENTHVIVKHEDETHGKWHRANITSVDVGKNQVGVDFLDWGGSAVVSWNNLKTLVQDFIKVECQSIIVKLADVERSNLEEPWPKEVADFLRSQLGSDEAVRMTVTKVEPLEVALFQLRPSANICLNSLLVEQELGASTGSISQTVCWPNLLDVEPEEDDALSSKMVKEAQEILSEDDDDIHLKSGFRQQVSVVNFKSPDLISVKFVKNKTTDDGLHKNLQIHCNAPHQTKTKKSWKKGELGVVLDSVYGNYFRVKIKAPCNDNNYIVYLMDEGRELKVSKNNLFVLDSYFKGIQCGVYKCRLAAVKPAGDAGTWSNLAIEILQKIFATYKNIHMKKVETNRDNRIMGVLMWYSLTTPTKALEPSKVKYISINKTLIESGVAFSLPIDTDIPEDIPAPCGQDAGNENVSVGSDTEKDQNDEDEENHRKSKKIKDKNQDWNDLIEDEKETEVVTSPTSWLELTKPSQPEFDAILTCVSSEGYFFLRDDEVHACYLDLEENLTATLNSKPRTKNNKWQVSDMCSIFFENVWYRGTVLEILNDEELSVEMIDFGSEHQVPVDAISMYIMFPTTPPLVYKIQLYDVQSNRGDWTGQDVSDVLSIVTDHVKVVIKGDLEQEIPKAEIYLDNGKSLNDLITRKCRHMIRCEKATAPKIQSRVVSNERINRDENGKVGSNLNYTYAPFHQKGKSVITSALKWDRSYFVVLSSKCSVIDSGEFTVLNDNIQRHIDAQPKLQNIQIEMPCVCFNSQRKVWSRALVYDTTNFSFGQIFAYFVDYGTIEVVSTSQVRELRPEWFHLPVYMRIASVDIQLLEPKQAEYVLMQLDKLRGKSVIVKVVSDPPLKVHLYDGNTLYYQNFVDHGVVKESIPS